MKFRRAIEIKEIRKAKQKEYFSPEELICIFFAEGKEAGVRTRKDVRIGI